jgi:hypothetical protein
MKKKKIDKVIEAFRNYINLKEEGMVTGAIANASNKPGQPIAIAGLPPDMPPVDLRKGKRRNWNPFFKDLAKMQRRNPPQ